VTNGFMVEAHCHSSKPQRGLFHKTEVVRHFLIMLYKILQIGYFLFDFKRTKILNHQFDFY